MTESPYAALQPGDQVWLHSRTGGRGGPTLETVVAVRRSRMDVTRYGSTTQPVNVSRVDGSDKKYDSFYWIRTLGQHDESGRRADALNVLASVGLRFDLGRTPASTGTLERLAAVIREDTP